MQMSLKSSNRYCFHCEVAEMISRNGNRIVKALCTPGTIIIEIPDDGNMQLGEKLLVTGTIHIESMETIKNGV